jgi:hypothetical protein
MSLKGSYGSLKVGLPNQSYFVLDIHGCNAPESWGRGVGKFFKHSALLFHEFSDKISLKKPAVWIISRVVEASLNIVGFSPGVLK